jgi:hypothetical protein
MYFDVHSDLIVVGFNPENADMDNPRGEIIREVFYVVLTFKSGRRFAHINRYLDQDEAYMLRQECEDTIGSYVIDEKDFDQGIVWEKIHSAYGSDDYSEYDTIEWEYNQNIRSY